MGFWDIKHFNVAMLGKQGWRLMTAPDTLCARVLEGKYYPNGDFLSARLKRNSSHTWRAILTGRKALNQGLVRRIGDGESTNIWRDRWIPAAVGGRPICQRPVRRQCMLASCPPRPHAMYCLSFRTVSRLSQLKTVRCLLSVKFQMSLSHTCVMGAGRLVYLTCHGF
jgi:hypothetical protein